MIRAILAMNVLLKPAYLLSELVEGEVQRLFKIHYLDSKLLSLLHKDRADLSAQFISI